MIVSPISHRTQSCTRFKYLGLKHSHKRQKTAVTSAKAANGPGIDLVIINQEFSSIHHIIQIFTTHAAINAGAKITSITAAPAVIGIENIIAMVAQEIIEHILTVVSTPAAVSILKIASAMNKNDSRQPGTRVIRFEQPGINSDSIPRLESDNFGVIPGVGSEFISGRQRYLPAAGQPATGFGDKVLAGDWNKNE